MLPAPNNMNCYEYLEYSTTSRFDDVYMMQHFGVKYMRSEIFRHMNALAGYFQKELGLKKGDVFTVFMPTTVQSIVAFYALNSIGVITSFVHPLMSTDFLKEQLETVGSKGVMVLDILMAKDKAHIETINNSDTHIYIKSIKLNGKPHNLPYIEHSDIAKGGKLTFEMSDTPAKWW